MQNHLQQGFMYPDAPVVFNEAKIAKAIHEETDSGPCCADHSREGLLRNLGNECFRTAIIAEFAHEQKNPGQTLFTGVEELIDQIGLKTHAALQKKLHEEVRELMLFVHDPDHLFSCDFESGTRSDGSGGGQTQPRHRCECFFSHEGVRG